MCDTTRTKEKMLEISCESAQDVVEKSCCFVINEINFNEINLKEILIFNIFFFAFALTFSLVLLLPLPLMLFFSRGGVYGLC